MIRRAFLVVAVVAAAAACTKGSSSPALRLDEPTAVAVFQGFTDRNATVSRPYAAVVNSGNDELVLVDAVDDAAVASSIAIRPLSVPLPDPRPALVAAARLFDDPPAVDATAAVLRPDLLVAVSSSSTKLQLVKTWLAKDGLPQPMVDDASAVELGQPVQALAAVPAVAADGSGNLSVVPGDVWVVAALAPTSGQGTDLAVVTYRRTSGGADGKDGPDAIVPVAGPVVQHLDFEVRSFGLDPSTTVTRRWNTQGSGSPTPIDATVAPLSPQYLYAASGDPIPHPGGVYGVAELETSPGPGSFTARGLDAGVPTTLVAGLTLAERRPDLTGTYDQVTSLPISTTTACGTTENPDDTTQDQYATTGPPALSMCPRLAFHALGVAPVPARRVYAVVDPAFCGPTQPMACGVAVLDPSQASAGHGQLLDNPFLGASADRVGTDPVLGVVWDRRHDDAAEPYLPPIAISGNLRALVPIPSPAWEPLTDRTYQRSPFMVVTEASGQHLTTGALAAVTATGLVYLIDAGRWEQFTSVQALAPGSPSKLAIPTYFAGTASIPQIGFYMYSASAAANDPSHPIVLFSDKVNAEFALARDPAPVPYLDSETQRVVQTYLSALTLGYTPDETFAITYQGYLPGLEAARPIEIEQVAGNEQELRVAFQARTPAGTPTLVYRVYDPSVGIRLGDIVEIWTLGEGDQCPYTQNSTDTIPIFPFEGAVVEIAAPDADHPGGSLVLGPPAPWVRLLSGYTRQQLPSELWDGTGTPPKDCRAALRALAGPASFFASTARVRARGADPAVYPDPTESPATPVDHEFLVAGTGLGYLGRAVERQPSEANAADAYLTDYRLRVQAESTLSCPLIPWPFDENGQASIDTSCDAACRARCEALAVSRKARRTATVSVTCAVDNETCAQFNPDFAVTGHYSNTPADYTTYKLQPSGPALAFRLGVDRDGKLNPDGSQKLLVRDTTVRFVTRSGLWADSRFASQYGGGSGVMPSGGAVFDRSRNIAWDKRLDGMRVFVPFLDNMLVDLTPSHTNSDTRQLR